MKNYRSIGGVFVTLAFLAVVLCPVPTQVSGSSPTQDMFPLVINEVLARVPSDNMDTPDVIEGDVNGDGTRGASADEFVELVNTGAEPFDLSGYELNDGGASAGFIFPMGTVVPPGEAVVVFGGGDLSLSTLEFGSAKALGLVFVTDGSIGTGFNNTSPDAAILKDPMGVIVARFDYDNVMTPVPPPMLFQSYNRDPEITGPFVNHRDIEVEGVEAEDRAFYSPGTRVDGRAFRRVITELSPAAGPLAGGNQVTISGAGFGNPISSVWFGSLQAPVVSRDNSLQVVVTAPATMTPGAVTVKVIDQFGDIVATEAYTYQAP